MSSFHILEPEVAGDLGPASVVEHSTRHPTVLLLEYEFNVWLGDDLLATHPCFIVTDRLRQALERFPGTGYSFGDVIVSTTDELRDRHPTLKLPKFHWLKVHGKAGRDDAGLTEDCSLVVSDRLLQVLREFNIDHCVVRKKPFRAKSSDAL